MALLTRMMSTVLASVLCGISFAIARALLGNVLDALPLDSEGLGEIHLGTLGRLGDLEGWQQS